MMKKKQNKIPINPFVALAIYFVKFYENIISQNYTAKKTLAFIDGIPKLSKSSKNDKS